MTLRAASRDFAIVTHEVSVLAKPKSFWETTEFNKRDGRRLIWIGVILATIAIVPLDLIEFILAPLGPVLARLLEWLMIGLWCVAVVSEQIIRIAGRKWRLWRDSRHADKTGAHRVY